MRASTAMKKLSMATATVALTALGTAGSAAAISLYSITDLGTLGGAYSVANDINNAGQVVGTSWRPIFPDERPFLWQNGTMTDLLANSFSKAGEAWSINDAGDIVGWRSGANYLNRVISINSANLPGVRFQFRPLAYVTDINNAGQMVFREDYFISYSNFLWDKGRITPLISIAGQYKFTVSDINDAGHVIGNVVSTLPDRGFLCDKGITYLNPPGGYTPPSGYTVPAVLCNNQPITNLDFSPSKINNAGQVIGSSVFWDKGKTTNLGSFGGSTQARDINEKGAVVGSSWTSSGAERAFLWEKDIMVDLNNLLPQNLGWELIQARGINDLGQIVGAGRFNGQTRAFLINPIPGSVWTPPNSGSGSSPNTGSQRVPEPTSLLGLLAFGVFGIATHKRQ